ncbi:MAG: cupin domain-containing protein [Deltaproteobacteria bacterium]|nr:cupin domain-containing protein [Deltaproteobacteria bacterium]MBW2123171.1 cupin domain-containing protein [Deltaproteobacteria bacterium]
MEVRNWKDVEEVKVENITYKGELKKVTGVGIRWLSRTGRDEKGEPEYGLRFFTVQPGGEIPIHDHFYVQTMYILSGRFECWRFDPETGEIAEKVICKPGDAIYAPSMEPHGMRNMSETEPGTFLCCICNVYRRGK